MTVERPPRAEEDKKRAENRVKKKYVMPAEQEYIDIFVKYMAENYIKNAQSQSHENKYQDFGELFEIFKEKRKLEEEGHLKLKNFKFNEKVSSALPKPISDKIRNKLELKDLNINLGVQVNKLESIRESSSFIFNLFVPHELFITNEYNIKKIYQDKKDYKSEVKKVYESLTQTARRSREAREEYKKRENIFKEQPTKENYKEGHLKLIEMELYGIAPTKKIREILIDSYKPCTGMRARRAPSLLTAFDKCLQLDKENYVFKLWDEDKDMNKRIYRIHLILEEIFKTILSKQKKYEYVYDFQRMVLFDIATMVSKKFPTFGVLETYINNNINSPVYVPTAVRATTKVISGDGDGDGEMESEVIQAFPSDAVIASPIIDRVSTETAGATVRVLGGGNKKRRTRKPKKYNKKSKKHDKKHSLQKNPKQKKKQTRRKQ
tara:strand:+ start:1515 stop:2819 length:1305 start_codon:yes stop_codon:yes gene_type:complete